MDSLPQIFVENVCLCLDRRSIRESCKILSWWGQVFSTTFKKIHTLCVFPDQDGGKLYAVAQASSHDAVPLDSVDLQFITSFSILPWFVARFDSEITEITLNQLQRLVQFIKPTTEGLPPVRYAYQSSNTLQLQGSTWISKKLLSMRLPVDSVYLSLKEEELQAAAEEFFENTGPLYNVTIWYTHSALKQSTVDALIDKFVPVDGGGFCLTRYTELTRAQLEKLVLKCERAGKKVMVDVCPEDFTCISKVTDFFDFDRHYSTKKVKDGEVIANRDGAKLVLRVTHLAGVLIWKWDSPCDVPLRVTMHWPRAEEARANMDTAGGGRFRPLAVAVALSLFPPFFICMFYLIPAWSL
uniref:FBA_2 domain-containing protein n=1 Tax=Steinernema glaseri TaxID=37863 RepID=A0A1I7YW19_9BILA